MDLKKNRLALAALLFVAATAGAIFAARSHSASTEIAEPDASLPTLEVDEVDTLVLTRPDKDETKLTFVKRDGEWQMTEPVASEADQDAVEKALEKLAELEVASVVTDKAELHDRLEITEDKAVRVQARKGDETLYDLWVGPNKSAGTLVRLEGEDRVLAVSGAVSYPFNKSAHLYRNRVITDLDAKQVTALRMTHAGKSFSFTRGTPDGEWQQAEGEAPIEEFDPGRVKTLVSMLDRLNASGFDAPDADPAELGLTEPETTVTLVVAPPSEDAEATEEGAEPTAEEGTEEAAEATTEEAAEPAAEEAAEPADDEGAALEEIQLVLGKLHEEDNHFSLRRKGVDKPFRISKYTGERLQVDAESFKKKDEPAARNAPGGNPHGMMPGGPGAGGGQLPPELMKQLQQQMARQQR